MTELPQHDRSPVNDGETTSSEPNSTHNSEMLDEAAFTSDHQRGVEAYTPPPTGDDTEDEAQHDLSPAEDSGYEYDESEPIEGHEEEEDDDQAPPVTFTNKRVLLIEDDKDTAQIISHHLKDMGFGEVTVTSNATGALNQLAKDQDLFPDIVLLELALIGMDGIQFLAQLRAHKSQRLQNLPAVVITMLDSPSIYRRAANQKVGAFLRKPVSTESLRKGMHDALSGQIVEKPFSQPKSWLDELDEDELRAKRNKIKAKASARAQKLGFWGRLLDVLIPWSGKA